MSDGSGVPVIGESPEAGRRVVPHPDQQMSTGTRRIDHHGRQPTSCAFLGIRLAGTAEVIAWNARLVLIKEHPLFFFRVLFGAMLHAPPVNPIPSSCRSPARRNQPSRDAERPSEYDDPPASTATSCGGASATESTVSNAGPAESRTQELAVRAAAMSTREPAFPALRDRVGGEVHGRVRQPEASTHGPEKTRAPEFERHESENPIWWLARRVPASN